MPGYPVAVPAWACSVDRWDDAWPESIKRGTIKAFYFIDKHKGTIAAVRRVVESLGYLIRITEWWQTTPPGAPGTSASMSACWIPASRMRCFRKWNA